VVDLLWWASLASHSTSETSVCGNECRSANGLQLARDQFLTFWRSVLQTSVGWFFSNFLHFLLLQFARGFHLWLVIDQGGYGTSSW
jgi:hypothetical protein